MRGGREGEEGGRVGSEGQGEVEEEGRREGNVGFPVGTQGQCNTRIRKNIWKIFE